MEGRFLQGGNPGTINAESLPNITGDIAINGNVDPSGAIYANTLKYNGYRLSPQSPDVPYFGFDASRSSSVYKNNARVQPDNMEVSFIIKY